MTKTLEKPAKRKPDSKKALAILRRVLARKRSHVKPLTPEREEEILASIKKTREELWKQYLASHPRR